MSPWFSTSLPIDEGGVKKEWFQLLVEGAQGDSVDFQAMHFQARPKAAAVEPGRLFAHPPQNLFDHNIGVHRRSEHTFCVSISQMRSYFVRWPPNKHLLTFSYTNQDSVRAIKIILLIHICLLPGAQALGPAGGGSALGPAAYTHLTRPPV